MSKLPLNFTLPVGLYYQDTLSRDVTLLKSDAVAEEVYTRKSPEKPYTYIADVIAVSVASVGNVQIASEVRDRYIKDSFVTIPDAVKALYLADANTLLLEIHRRCWQNVIKNQSIVCKFCARQMQNVTIDLNKIEMSPDNIAKLDNYRGNVMNISVDLEDSFDMKRFVDEINKNKPVEQHKFLDIRDLTFNRMVFRIPTLGDAINYESFVTRRIDFWRRIGADCLLDILAVDSKGETIGKFPMEYKGWLGILMYDYLGGEDLKKVRNGLIEEAPTMGFAYEEECPCDMRRLIPMAMEASSFFSE